MTANPTPPGRPTRPLGLLDPTLAALTRALYEREMLIGQLGQQIETLTVERDALTKGQGSDVKEQGPGGVSAAPSPDPSPAPVTANGKH